MKERNFIFSSKTFQRTCFKNGLCMSLGTFWGKEILITLQLFNSFELLTKKMAFCQNSLAQLSNLHSTCP